MEHTQQEPLFNAAVSQLGLAAFDGLDAWGIKQITLPNHSSQGTPCDVLIPKTCLVALKIFEPKRGYTEIHTTCYHGTWCEVQIQQLCEDLTLMMKGRRRDLGGKTELHGSLQELRVWIGSGQTGIRVAKLPESEFILADNLLLSAMLRY